MRMMPTTRICLSVNVPQQWVEATWLFLTTVPAVTTTRVELHMRLETVSPAAET